MSVTDLIIEAQLVESSPGLWLWNEGEDELDQIHKQLHTKCGQSEHISHLQRQAYYTNFICDQSYSLKPCTQ